MKLTSRQFRDWENKCISLVGMAGVGKTRMSAVLRRHNWFHYSADYRIGTRYLAEPILDNIKAQAMRVPFLRELLRTDSIYINNNITVDNLHPVTSFLGHLGNPESGGLSLPEFKRRQALYRRALAEAMRDVPEFIRKAREIYGYRHFVNDTPGSLCELDAPEIAETIARHTVVVHIRPTGRDRERLLREVTGDLRPLCYREEFLDEHVAAYLRETGLSYVALLEPGEFYRWVLPRLCDERIRRYEEILRKDGTTISMAELEGVRDEAGFLALIEEAIDRAPDRAS